MSEVPVSSAALERQNCAILVSRSIVFQTLIGLPGPPVDEPTALARVYFERVLVPIRPFVVLGVESSESYEKASGSRVHSGRRGEISCRFEMDIDAAYLQDNDDTNPSTQIYNFAGGVIDNMRALAGSDDNFLMKNTTELVINRGDVDEVTSGGSYMQAHCLILYDEGD